MIILLFCLTGEKGDGPKFIMCVELFPFVKNFIVEINGLYVVFAYFSRADRALRRRFDVCRFYKNPAYGGYAAPQAGNVVYLCGQRSNCFADLGSYSGQSL